MDTKMLIMKSAATVSIVGIVACVIITFLTEDARWFIGMPFFVAVFPLAIIWIQ